MPISEEKVFQGKIFRDLIKKNKANTLFYKQLNLNKTWLSDLIPDYTNRNDKNYYKIFKNFIKIIKKIFFYEYELNKKNNGKNDIWIITSNSIRKSFDNLIKLEEKNFKKPSVISWNRKFKIKSIYKIFNEIKYSCLSFIYLKKISKNIDTLDIVYKTLISIDLYDSKILHIPKSILSLKDFQRHENAIVQKANLLKIKTFTTQHAVHPNFIKNNERGGNLVFFNCESKNILLWGNFLKNIYLKYNKNKNFYYSRNLFMPKIKKISLRKKGILFCLGGKRHIFENLQMLNLITKDKEYFKKNFKIFIKMHPSMKISDFNKHFSQLLRGVDFKIFVSKKNSNQFIVNKNLFAITGLSGSYYDCLYLGLKTLFFDYGYEISNLLPRSFNNLNSQSNLKMELLKIEKVPTSVWIDRSSLILKKVWGISKENKNFVNLTDQISKNI